jgi:hypothetical protein
MAQIGPLSISVGGDGQHIQLETNQRRRREVYIESNQGRKACWKGPRNASRGAPSRGSSDE